MTYPLYIFFALLPSIIWLCFYLRKDVHPESNRMIVKIFLYGMLAAIPAALIELGFYEISSKLSLSRIFILILNVFIAVALVEEFLKYLVVKEKVISDPEFDEPVDAMLYMIIAALGFAAMENILIFFGEVFEKPYQPFLLSITRFISATFLHALCSGLVGYYLARSFFEIKKRFKLLLTGLTISIVLHGLYNFSIIEMEGGLKFLVPVIILISLAIFVSRGFKRLKKLASVCRIEADKR